MLADEQQVIAFFLPEAPIEMLQIFDEVGIPLSCMVMLASSPGPSPSIMQEKKIFFPPTLFLGEGERETWGRGYDYDVCMHNYHIMCMCMEYPKIF